jgi:hypothetical protein
MTTIVAVIMFPMSTGRTDRLGYYVGYMICEAFASTGLNLVCAYIAASIPYANATFTLHYFYGILMGGYYITGWYFDSLFDSFAACCAVDGFRCVPQTSSCSPATPRSRYSGSGSHTTACGSSRPCAMNFTVNPSLAPRSKSSPLISPGSR